MTLDCGLIEVSDKDVNRKNEAIKGHFVFLGRIPFSRITIFHKETDHSCFLYFFARINQTTGYRGVVMFIGLLNHRISSINLTVCKKNLAKAPAATQIGNPFLGEPLSVSWTELIASGLDLHVRLSETYLLNTALIRLGEKSAPLSVSVWTAGKKRLLSRYAGETGKPVTARELPLSIEAETNEFIIEIDPGFSDILIEQIELFGADLSGEQLYPTPRSYQATSCERLPLSLLTSFCADCAEGRRAGEILSEKLMETASLSVPAVENGFLSLRQDQTISENGYALTVCRTGITIAASDLRGFISGVETLIKLVKDASLPLCEIQDAPFTAFRGAHLHLPAEEHMDFARRLIKYILSPMGYNHIILEIAGAMQFDSHPEINAAFEEAVAKGKAGIWPPFPHGTPGGGKTVSKEKVRAFVEYARSYGLEVIPEIQSLGHVQFMTQAHPEIAERAAEAPAYSATDERLADVPPSDFYAHCFCPSNPKSYEILFDIADEIIDTIRPAKFVHMGHDEVYQIGICPVCSKRDPADLFAEDIHRLHEYLAKKGLRMMIWSDMLQPCTRYLTPPAIDRIPKDVVMMDFIWYFHPEKDIEDNLLPHGFDLIYGNMYSSHFTRYESRIRKKGVTGAEVSCWTATTEQALGREGKLYDFLYSAQMMWSEAYAAPCRYAYDRMISALIPRLREQIQNISYPALAVGAQETSLFDAGAFDPKNASVGGSFVLGTACRSLVFEHATTLPFRKLPWLELEAIGRYQIVYADGTEASIPVTYAGNISHWARRHNEPFSGMYYRHTGYTATWFTDAVETLTPEGQPATLYRFEWINPKPDTVIERIAYLPDEEAETSVIVQKITGIR